MSRKQWGHGFHAGKKDQYIEMKDEYQTDRLIYEIDQLRWRSKHLLLTAAEKIEQISTDSKPYNGEDIIVLIRSAETLFNESNRLAFRLGIVFTEPVNRT